MAITPIAKDKLIRKKHSRFDEEWPWMQKCRVDTGSTQQGLPPLCSILSSRLGPWLFLSDSLQGMRRRWEWHSWGLWFTFREAENRSGGGLLVSFTHWRKDGFQDWFEIAGFWNCLYFEGTDTEPQQFCSIGLVIYCDWPHQSRGPCSLALGN